MERTFPYYRKTITWNLLKTTTTKKNPRTHPQDFRITGESLVNMLEMSRGESAPGPLQQEGTQDSQLRLLLAA